MHDLSINELDTIVDRLKKLLKAHLVEISRFRKKIDFKPWC